MKTITKATPGKRKKNTTSERKRNRSAHSQLNINHILKTTEKFYHVDRRPSCRIGTLRFNQRHAQGPASSVGRA